MLTYNPEGVVWPKLCWNCQ